MFSVVSAFSSITKRELGVGVWLGVGVEADGVLGSGYDKYSESVYLMTSGWETSRVFTFKVIELDRQY